MTYDDISLPMRNFLGAFEALRKLGFASEDLYCSVNPSVRLGGVIGAFCILKTQGKEFKVECGPVADRELFYQEWQMVCRELPTLPQADFDRIWQESEPFRYPEAFLFALAAKGLTPPKGAS